MDVPTVLINSTSSRALLASPSEGSRVGTAEGTLSAGGEHAHSSSAVLSSTAEPLLDDEFYSMIQSHFNSMAETQTGRLQQKLNTGLPAIMESLGCSPVVAKRRGQMM